MRKYQLIWKVLKQDGNAKLTAPVHRHKRIIKAVRKEKVNDVGWKLLQSEQKKRYKLKEDIEGDMITFTLEVDNGFYIRDIIL